MTANEDGFVEGRVNGRGQMGSVCLREDGRLLMIGRGSRIFVKENGSDAWELKTEEKVNPIHMFGLYEDPVIWRTEVQYHMIVNDWQGRLAYHQRSMDGINWTCDTGLAYTVGVDSYTDGIKVDWLSVGQDCIV